MMRKDTRDMKEDCKRGRLQGKRLLGGALSRELGEEESLKQTLFDNDIISNIFYVNLKEL